MSSLRDAPVWRPSRVMTRPCFVSPAFTSGVVAALWPRRAGWDLMLFYPLRRPCGQNAPTLSMRLFVLSWPLGPAVRLVTAPRAATAATPPSATSQRGGRARLGLASIPCRRHPQQCSVQPDSPVLFAPAEQLTLNQRVQGSNPCTPTSKVSDLERARRRGASQKVRLGSIWEAERLRGEHLATLAARTGCRRCPARVPRILARTASLSNSQTALDTSKT